MDSGEGFLSILCLFQIRCLKLTRKHHVGELLLEVSKHNEYALTLICLFFFVLAVSEFILIDH